MKNTRTILLAAAVAAATGIFIFKWNVKDHRGVEEGKGVPLAAPAPGSQVDGDLLSSAFLRLRRTPGQFKIQDDRQNVENPVAFLV